MKHDTQMRLPISGVWGGDWSFIGKAWCRNIAQPPDIKMFLFAKFGLLHEKKRSDKKGKAFYRLQNLSLNTSLHLHWQISSVFFCYLKGLSLPSSQVSLAMRCGRARLGWFHMLFWREKICEVSCLFYFSTRSCSSQKVEGTTIVALVHSESERPMGKFPHAIPDDL